MLAASVAYGTLEDLRAGASAPVHYRDLSRPGRALASRDPRVILVVVADLAAFKHAAGSVVPDLGKTLDRWIRSQNPKSSRAGSTTVRHPRGHRRMPGNAGSAATPRTRPSQPWQGSSRVMPLRDAESPRPRPWADFARPALYKVLTEKIEDRRRPGAGRRHVGDRPRRFPVGYRVPRHSPSPWRTSPRRSGRGRRGSGPLRRGLDPIVPALLRHAEHDPDPEVRGHLLHGPGGLYRPPKVTPSIIPDLIKASGES